jgi:hypothetical protein
MKVILAARKALAGVLDQLRRLEPGEHDRRLVEEERAIELRITSRARAR